MEIDKIIQALIDPNAPWYGSDLVDWVADLIEDYKAQAKRIEELKADLIEYGRHQPGCSQEHDKKYRCRWEKVEQALKENQ